MSNAFVPSVPLTPQSEETTQKPHDEPLKCVTGWSNWINRGPPEIGPSGESIDNEPLPRPNELVKTAFNLFITTTRTR